MAYYKSIKLNFSVEDGLGEISKSLFHAVEDLLNQSDEKARYLDEVYNSMAKYALRNGDAHVAITYTSKSIQYLEDNIKNGYGRIINPYKLKAKALIMSNDKVAINKMAKLFVDKYLGVCQNIYSDLDRENFIRRGVDVLKVLLNYYMNITTEEGTHEKIFNITNAIKDAAPYLSRAEKVKQNLLDDNSNPSYFDSQIFEFQKTLLEDHDLSTEEELGLVKQIKALEKERDRKYLYDSAQSSARYEYSGISALEKELDSSELYICYFSFKGYYYSISIGNSKTKLHQLEKISIVDSLVDSLAGNIYSYYKNCQNQNSIREDNIDIFKGLSSTLFSKILVSKEILHYDKLIISPDGKLHKFPFDALVDLNGRFLVQSHSLSYNFRMDLDEESILDSSENNSGVFLFALENYLKQDTICDTDRYRSEYLGPLYHNKEEIEFIKSHINATSVSSKSKLLECLQSSILVHLATHGKLNNSNDNFSYIALQDSLGNLNKLYLNEIGHNSVNVDCLVLSACESGLGKHYVGQGVKSMASCSLDAGARSVIGTLWAVNDRATSLIMKHFYKFLAAGKTKNQSLRLAKLEYLESTDPEYFHPYYWAGFVAYGDMSSIDFKKSHIKLKWFLVVLGTSLFSVMTAKYFVSRK